MLFISSTSHSTCIMHRGSGENLFTVEKIVCECIVCMWRVCFLHLVCANIHNAHAGLFVFHFCISVPFLFFAFNLNWLNSLFEIPPRRVDARKKKTAERNPSFMLWCCDFTLHLHHNYLDGWQCRNAVFFPSTSSQHRSCTMHPLSMYALNDGH